MRIGFISIGAGGTMGHMTFVTSIADELLNSKNSECFIFSESEYGQFSNIQNEKINYIKIKKQPHQKSIAGNITYKYKKNILKKIKKLKIDTIVFSTFYDEEFITELKKMNIRTILHTFLFRDSHFEIFKLKKYYMLFDSIFILKDLYYSNIKLKNEIIVTPILKKTPTKKQNKNIKKILIVAGGGGRPSVKLFFKKIGSIVKKFSNIEFTIITANSKINLNGPNVSSIPWTNNFSKLAQKHDLVICESGYNTLMELISINKPAITIPGSRRIDNQELRAIKYEQAGCGYYSLPEESISEITNKIKFLISNPKKIKSMIESNKKTFIKIMKGQKINKNLIKNGLQ